MGKPEYTVESYLVHEVRKIGGLCPKLTAPGCAGWPDRGIFYNRCVVLVEVKSPSGSLQPIQKKVIEKLRAQRVPVAVVKTKEAVDVLIQCIKCLEIGDSFHEEIAVLFP